MSYCVHCGVELDKTMSKCPLCQIPVYNPKEPVDTKSAPPFPTEKGTADSIRRTDAAILVSVIFVSTALACGLLNLFVYRSGFWSFYIAGACVMLWIFFIPALIYHRISPYLALILDGTAVALYCGVIAVLYPGNGWYFAIAFPIIVMATVLALFYVFLTKSFSSSILLKSIFLFSGIAILSVGIELLLQWHLFGHIWISWSAVVLTCCFIIVITLTTIIKRTRLREEVRRRMHI